MRAVGSESNNSKVGVKHERGHKHRHHKRKSWWKSEMHTYMHLCTDVGWEFAWVEV